MGAFVTLSDAVGKALVAMVYRDRRHGGLYIKIGKDRIWQLPSQSRLGLKTGLWEIKILKYEPFYFFYAIRQIKYINELIEAGVEYEILSDPSQEKVLVKFYTIPPILQWVDLKHYNNETDKIDLQNLIELEQCKL